MAGRIHYRDVEAGQGRSGQVPGSIRWLLGLVGLVLVSSTGAGPIWPDAMSAQGDFSAGAGAVQAHEVVGCGESVPAARLALLIASDPGQRRPELRCSPKLSRIASERARELAEEGRISHFTNGRSPNLRLRQSGYPLPREYPHGGANQVEAIAGGYAGPEDVWAAFKRSDRHRSHLLGEHEFFQEQDEIGVGFHRLRESPHVEYWVVFVARRLQPDPGPFASRGDTRD
jgi:hypothetical protein